MFKAVIFDLDGVLVDTADLHFDAWQKVSIEYGLSCGINMIDGLKGVSRAKCLEMIIKQSNRNISESMKIDILTKKNDLYLEKIKSISGFDILPGVNEILKFLERHHIKIALGSASKNADFILTKTELGNYFDAIVDGNMISNAKPDPEVFLRAAELINISPHDCLVIEDAKSGVEAAKRAGMQVIGVGEEKLLSEANLIVPNLNANIVKEYISQFSYNQVSI